jgi:hypothetical protein
MRRGRWTLRLQGAARLSGKVVLLGEGLRLLAQMSRRSHVHAVRVLQDVVQPGGRLPVRRWRGGASSCRSSPGAQTGEGREEHRAAGGEHFAPRPRCRSQDQPPIDRHDQPKHSAVLVHQFPAAAGPVGEAQAGGLRGLQGVAGARGLLEQLGGDPELCCQVQVVGSGEWILGDVGARVLGGLIPQILTWITAQIP